MNSDRLPRPVEIDEDEIQLLRESEQALRKPTDELVSEWDKPLIVRDGKILQGVYWINGAFLHDFWTHARKKPKPTKCICEHCGNKHHLKQASPSAPPSRLTQGQDGGF
jgi:hypothetical protein